MNYIKLKMIRKNNERMHKKVYKNMAMQYLMSIAQYIFPLLTFPYLTRLLEPEGYAIIVYMGGIVIYFQHIIDFGFTLSSTKDIAQMQGKPSEIEKVWGSTTQAKMLLSVVSIVLFSCIIPFISIMRDNLLISYLFLFTPLLSVFLPDYLFRGLEDMGVITIRFVVTKSISTALTFILVRGREDILLIPLLSIASSMVAIVLTQIQIKKKYHLKMRIVKMKEVISNIRESWTYFISTIATTAFGVFNTFMLGIMPTVSMTDIGYWGAFYTIIGAAQGLYVPIVNSIYPHMAKVKDFIFIKKILWFFMPAIIVTSVLTWVFAKDIINILCGSEYLAGLQLFRLMVPLLIISFPVLILNFPVLGATGNIKETAKLTIMGACFHISALVVIAAIGRFTVENVAIIRVLTEAMLLFLVIFYIRRKTDFFKDNRD